MKKLGILALLLAVMMIITSIAVAEYTIDEYRWRYSGSTLKKGHGGKNSPHLKQYVANVQGDIWASGDGDCRGVDGIYGNNTVGGVKSYQRVHNLTADGETGKWTKNPLYHAFKDCGHWDYPGKYD